MHVALLWLINEHGEILLSRRALDISSDPGMWGPSVSGGVEPDETPEVAAVREAEEELGINAATLEPHFLHNESHDHADGQRREFTVFYARIPRDSRDSFVLEPTEVAETKWVDLAELRRLLREENNTMLIGANSALWQRLAEHLEPVVAG